MVILKFKNLIYFFVFYIALVLSASALVISEVKVNCFPKNACLEIETDFKFLKNVTIEPEELKYKIGLIVPDLGIEEFGFEVIEESGINTLNINVIKKKLVKDIQINGSIKGLDYSLIKSQLPFNVGDYLDLSSLAPAREKLNSFLTEKGYLKNIIKIKVDDIDDESANLVFDIESSDPLRVDHIVYNSDIEMPLLQRVFNRFERRTFDKLLFREKLEIFQRELVAQGFLQAKCNFNFENKNGKSVVTIKVVAGDKSLFSVIAGPMISSDLIHQLILETIKNAKEKLNKDYLVAFLKAHYRQKGFFGTEVVVRVENYKTKAQGTTVNYFIKIKEGRKYYLDRVDFNGATNEMKELLFTELESSATDLVSAKNLDEAFFEQFTDNIKKTYLKHGRVFVKVSPPRTEFNPDKNSAVVSYMIEEGRLTTLSSIKIDGVSDDKLQKELIDTMTNKLGRGLDIVSFNQDLNNIVVECREKGYLDAEIETTEGNEFIKYSSDFQSADINIKLKLNKKFIYENLVVSGLRSTKEVVVSRENHFQKNDVLTQSEIVAFKQRLSETGLFAKINFHYVQTTSANDAQDNSRVNLVVQVQERKFQSIDLALGYRSELGIKFSTGFTHNNLFGMNRIWSINTQANLRTDYSSLDERRRDERKQRIEHVTKISYIEPYLIGKQLQLDIGASLSRKRYYGFDADIFRTTVGLSKNFFKYMNVGIRYQLENISQFDATDKQNDDRFTIGGINPSINLDFLDNKVLPRNGSEINFSYEHANRFFLSASEPEINYYKAVFKVRSYYSINKITFATMFSTGKEENLSAQGFIPNVKLFRLGSLDSVRGYSDSEVNRLISNEDIRGLIVHDSAYFVNFKFEPRYNLSDLTMIGCFFDAGRLFVNHFQPLRLRTAAGLSLKFKTPVGTLDFDYGIKLKRDKDKESFGALSYSIGYF